MKKTLILLTLMIFATSVSSAGKPRVVTTYPWIAGIVSHIAKDRVRVESLAEGDLDPHTIIPKPSHIARLRKADLLIINGAQLEIGWLPPLIRQAGNGSIVPGSTGFLDLSGTIKLMDKPASVSRAMGDVHPDGNPHFSLDPDNIPLIARAVTDRLKKLDPVGSSEYESGYREFAGIWRNKNREWKEKLAPLKGKRVIEYHRIYDYFLRYAGLELAGTLEPLPGIPPSSGHIGRTGEIIRAEGIAFILQDVYNPDTAARHLSSKYNVPLVILPHDIDAVEGTDDIVRMFDVIVGRLTQ